MKRNDETIFCAIPGVLNWGIGSSGCKKMLRFCGMDGLSGGFDRLIGLGG